MADVYVWKSKGVKNKQDYTQKNFGTWGFLLTDEKMYFVSHSHVKKIVVKFVILCINKYFFLFYFFISDCFFFIQKKEEEKKIILFVHIFHFFKTKCF